MARLHECPSCGEPMQYQEDEPDVGITGGWSCDACNIHELADMEDDSDG